MKARLLPIALGVGLSLLALGLWRLATIFEHERGAALAASDARREALRQYAGAALRQRATARLSQAAATAARVEAEPLLPDRGLLWIRGGVQVLPRAVAPAPGVATPGVDRLRALRDSAHRPTAEGPWGERLAIRARFLDALAAADAAGLSDAFRALLVHRARFVLPVEQDLPLTLSLLEAFHARGTPVIDTLRQLVYRGLADRSGRLLEGLQPQLLRRRSAFTAPDFGALADAVLAFSKAIGAPTAEFEARRADAPAAIPPVDGVAVQTWRGDWLLRPESDAVLGVWASPADEATALTDAMRSGGLLGADEAVDLRTDPGVALGALRPDIAGPAWAAAVAEARRAWQLKMGLLALAGLLAVGLVALALSAHRRKQRYLGLKSDFVSAVSHELRTPLASMRAMAETLHRRFGDAPLARDYPARIVRDVDTLSVLVENILSFNRLDKGRWVARREVTRLAEVVDRTRDALADWAQRPVTWTITGPLAGVTLHADAELLRLLFANLARNACAYNDRDPVQLTVEVRPSPEALEVWFGDNGRGVPAEALDHIFTAFYRAPQGRPSRGSGLGLALCQRIMRLHGGRIAVQRTGPEGTVFALRFTRKGGSWAGS